MKYLPLFNLFLTHTYYADGRCPDFQIAPTLETRRLLDNYRCVARPLPDGVRILAAAADAGATFIRMEKGLTFAFRLVLRNPDFALFTDLTGIAPAATPLYANQRLGSGEPVRLELVSRQIPPAPRRSSAAFANVEIVYSDSPPAIAPGPAAFELAFEARQVWWKYYVVTDNASDAFRIADQDKETPLAFDDVSDADKAPDGVAAALAEQYPKMRVLRFLSASAVPCHQQARRSLQLFAGGDVAVGALPNPSIRNYAIDVQQDSLPAKSCLFHVVKYFAYLGSTSGG